MKSKTNLELVVVACCIALAINTAVARPWGPTDATNGTLVVWFDADDGGSISTNASGVTEWRDKSGNGNHATNAVASELPVYANSEIYFDGANDILKINNDPFNGLQRPTVLVAARWDGQAASTYGNSMVSWHNRIRLGAAFQDNLHYSLNAIGNYLIQNGRDLNMMTNDFIGVGFAESSANKAHKRVNGTITQTADFNQAIIYTNSVRSALGMMCAADNWGTRTAPYKGWLKEVVVVDEVNLATVQKIEGYLAWKWGLQAKLPSGHPYENEPPPEIPPAGTVVVIK